MKYVFDDEDLQAVQKLMDRRFGKPQLVDKNEEDDTDPSSESSNSDSADDITYKIFTNTSAIGNVSKKAVTIPESCNDKTLVKSDPVPDSCPNSCPSEDSNNKAAFTDDGFRIVSFIPDDDSDVSEAFDESGSEDNSDSDFETEDIQNMKSKLNQKHNDNKKKLKTIIFETKESKVSDSLKKTVKSTISNKRKREELTNNSVSELIMACNKDSETQLESSTKKKRKRGGKGKNKAAPPCLVSEGPRLSKCQKKNIKKIEKKKLELEKKCPPLPMTEEEKETFKKQYSIKYQKLIDHCEVPWERIETIAQREQREVDRLPQPEQHPNCLVYLKKDHITDNVITVYDFSKKPQFCKQSHDAAAPKKESADPEEEREVLLEKRKLDKVEQKKQFRDIRRTIDAHFMQTCDADEKEKRGAALIEKLGGAKIKTPFINYKLLMEQNKKAKVDDLKNKEHLKNIGMHDLLTKKRRVRRRRDANDVPGFNNVGGRYRDGVMVLSKKDMSRITGS